MKRCFKCKKLKPISCFYAHKEMADGHLGKCKECTKKDVHEHRVKNLERVQAYDRERGRLSHRKIAVSERQKKNKERHNKANREYLKKYPDRKIARSLIGNHKRDGKLTPKPCEVCGTMERIHGHHADYSKPDEVVWLCQKHHMELHRKYA